MQLVCDLLCELQMICGRSNIEGAVMPHVVSTLSVLATAIKQKKKCLVFAEVNSRSYGGAYRSILKLLSSWSQAINN